LELTVGCWVKEKLTYHSKIIDGKEVEASVEEDILDSDEDENSPKVSLASITCIR
jgi:hypothetical protein